MKILYKKCYDVTAIILCSMCFEIDCVFACFRSYEGLRLKAHVVAMHGVQLVFASGVTNCEDCLYR